MLKNVVLTWKEDREERPNKGTVTENSIGDQESF